MDVQDQVLSQRADPAARPGLLGAGALLQLATACCGMSINVRPAGKLEGTIRDDGHLDRFSGLKRLPVAVLPWLSEAPGPPS